MMNLLRSHLTIANVMVYVFLLVANTLGGAYAFYGLDAEAFGLLTQFGLLYVVGYWLLNDSQKRNFKLPYCPGLILSIAWPILLPYYLFKTRGGKAFLTILIFAGAYILTTALGAVIAAIFIGPQFD